MRASGSLVTSLDQAKALAKRMGDTHVAVDHLIWGVANDSTVAAVLGSAGMGPSDIERAIGELRKGRKVTGRSAESTFEALAKYGTNLVQRAREGKLDPVIGRDEEIRRALHVLARRTKNNPVLTGPPGCGKTAIVEALAQRIADGDVPDSVNAELYSLDMGALIAGASHRGEFEERLKAVLDEVRNAREAGQQVLLFIDEIHTLMGAGKADGAMDAANLMKPALARGELRCIGATTDEEYRKYIEKDPAFERRLQRVRVTEPSVAETVAILRGVANKYELYHGVSIRDSALMSAATLSHRYIPARMLPDKAIDLVDEAAASVRVQLDSKPQAIDELNRRITTLEIELKAVEKDSAVDKEQKRGGVMGKIFGKGGGGKDSSGANAGGSPAAASKAAEVIRDKIEKLREELAPLVAAYDEQRGLVDEISAVKRRIEEVERKAAVKEREKDLAAVADLRYGALPELRARLDELVEQDRERKAVIGARRASEESADEDGGGGGGSGGSAAPMLNEIVTSEHIAEIVSRWTGIPVTKLGETDRARLLALGDRLRQRVVGQDAAVDAVSAAVLRNRAGLGRRNAPIGSFLFLGPTGVGKTEVAKCLANELFLDPRALIRIDSSELGEQHAVARLIGAPPGYIGHDEGGQLTEAVRQRPFSVVLFDEVEKAHPSVWNVLLQVLDDGRLTDSKGITVDFSNALIIMTSNLGSQHLLAGIDTTTGVTVAGTEDKVMDDVRRFFKPELINRLDELVIFEPLSKQSLHRVLQLQLAVIEERLVDKDITLSLTSEAAEEVLRRSYDPTYGARPLKRFLEKHVTTELSRLLVRGDVTEHAEIEILPATDGRSIFTFNVLKRKREMMSD
jgi:ATP-dependent Clp protease ATP-binding subunit ClpB